LFELFEIKGERLLTEKIFEEDISLNTLNIAPRKYIRKVRGCFSSAFELLLHGSKNKL